jgi:hypothetical protein
MDEETKEPAGPTDETFSWQGADTADAGMEAEAETGSTSDRAREWLSQLEVMIGNIAEQAAPVVREVGAKAAELAAVAADRAGPVAHRAADWFDEKGPAAAERARRLAADLRSALPEEGGESESTPGEDSTAAPSGDATAAPGGDGEPQQPSA